MSLRTLKPRLRKVLKTRPRRFQAAGILFLEKANGRALLGDDMGLGKTLQVLAYLALHPEIRPVVIVCPSNAKYVWQDQIQRHIRRMECQILFGRTPFQVSSSILIINYDILHYWESYLLALKPQALIIDECHNIKTRKIKRTKVCKKLAHGAKVIIPMSGTPVINRPNEFFPVLNMICPKEFKSYWEYAFRYCGPKRGWQGRGWRFDGATNIQELYQRIQPFMLRRMKEDVLTELPPKQSIPIFTDLSNQTEYEEARDSFLTWYKKEYGSKKMKKAKHAEGFVKIGQLRQLAAKGKIQAAFQWIDNFLETTDQKLVIFCYHKTIFRTLADRYNKIAALGGKNGAGRKTEEDRFQYDNKYRLFIGSLKADKEAITLTAASTVLFIEMGWTPGEHDQAGDRVNRIGQTAGSIFAYYLLARNSIDEYIWELVEKKRRVIAQIVDGEESEQQAGKRISLQELMENLNSEEKR